MAIKVTPKNRSQHETITVNPAKGKNVPAKAHKWWNANSKKDLANQLISTFFFIKEQQQYRYRQAGIFSRLYGNAPIFNVIGNNINRMNMGSNLPIDRPTMNVVQSCVDTLVSRITQRKPSPVFLTDNGDYKERNMAKQMNNFIAGEFFRMKAYQMGECLMRDAAILGDGVCKVLEKNKKVALERRLSTEVLVDEIESRMGDPRQLFEMALMDRSVVEGMFPEYKTMVRNSEQAFPDYGGDSQKSISDQIMVVEAWHLPSTPDSNDGLHAIVCSEGVLFDEVYQKEKFPFVKIPYSPRQVGWWSQGLAEQLMGTQVEINKLLMTITKSINLVGVPRVFIEEGSKVLNTSFNNEIGSLVKFRGNKPMYEVAPCVPVELYQQLERLVNYSYQQAGISQLAAQAKKPAGLNSGEAIRNYDELQSDRFATIDKYYTQFYIDLAYLNLEEAKEIAERDGTYSTVYPNKDGTKEVDLPKIELLDNPVIQCFDQSSLPREPAGRLEKVVEMMQAGLVSPSEGRRLLDYPDIEQVDKLANAAEERILKALDDIIESGKYSPPDPFMDLALAEQLTNQYYNRYVPAKLEESKAQKLRDFWTQIQDLKQAAMPPMPAVPAQPGPQGVPMPQQQSPMLPNVPINQS